MTLDQKSIVTFLTTIFSIISLIIVFAVVSGLMGCAALQKDKAEVKQIIVDAIDEAMLPEPKNVPPPILPPSLMPETKTLVEKKDV